MKIRLQLLSNTADLEPGRHLEAASHLQEFRVAFAPCVQTSPTSSFANIFFILIAEAVWERDWIFKANWRERVWHLCENTCKSDSSVQRWASSSQTAYSYVHIPRKLSEPFSAFPPVIGPYLVSTVTRAVCASSSWRCFAILTIQSRCYCDIGLGMRLDRW